ncbi:MAG TPA: serine protease [Actinomycetota bacterium]|nr:serine protease [Actinomycetota bacterium]
MRSSSYPPQYGGYPNPVPPAKGPEEPTDFGNLLTPKSVVSLAIWVLMFGLGAGLSGLILFIIYQGQINDLRSELENSQQELRESLEERIQQAPKATESPSLNVSAAEQDPLKELVSQVAPAIVGITGRDSGGAPVSGTGFVVNSGDEGTWVVTSYRLVAGVRNFNELSIRSRNSDLVGEVYETDPGRDLALVIYHVDAGRSLRFSRVEEPKEGDQVWAIGTLRSQPYATGIAAKLTRVGPSSLTLDASIPDAYVGGPLVDADGRVLGVLTSSRVSGASASPAAPGGEGTATTIEQVCLRVLRCPSRSRDTSTPGTGATPTPRPSGAAAPPPPPAAEPAPPPPPPGEVVQPPISNPNTADVPIG